MTPNCPCCGRTMERGTLRSTDSLFWTPECREVGVFSLMKQGTCPVAVRRGPVAGAGIPAWRCPDCGRVLTEPPEEV